VAKIQSVRTKLLDELDRFEKTSRLNVIKPYANTLETNPEEPSDYGFDQLPSHRYLFNCYVYQYHLMRFASMLGDLLDHIILLESRPERRHRRVWTPLVQSHSIKAFFHWIKSAWTTSDGVDHCISSGGEGHDGDEEDPDRVQHVDRGRGGDASSEISDNTRVDEDDIYGMGLPNPKRRDPDTLPPRNVWEGIGNWIYKRVVGITSGNALYAVKAGVLTS
jgi:hypothetical protein